MRKAVADLQKARNFWKSSYRTTRMAPNGGYIIHECTLVRTRKAENCCRSSKSSDILRFAPTEQHESHPMGDTSSTNVPLCERWTKEKHSKFVVWCLFLTTIDSFFLRENLITQFKSSASNHDNIKLGSQFFLIVSFSFYLSEKENEILK